MSVTILGSAQAALQVITKTSSTPYSTTSTALLGTDIAASINPQNSANKVLVLVSVNGMYNTGTPPTGVGIVLYKNGSLVYTPTYTNASGYLNIYGNNVWGSTNFAYLDSPASTSTQYYQVFYSSFSAGTAYVNYTDGSAILSPSSTITLIEVSGA